MAITITRDIELMVEPDVPKSILLECFDVKHCACPHVGSYQKDPYFITVFFIGLMVSYDGVRSLRHAMYEALLDRRLRFLSNYEALYFNSKYPIVQWEHPFVNKDYAFGIAGRDSDNSSQNSRRSLEFSTISQFASEGTSRSLRIAATKPTHVDQGFFDGDIIQNDFEVSLLKWRNL